MFIRAGFLAKNSAITYRTTVDDAMQAFDKYVKVFKKSVSPDGINSDFNEQINALVSGITRIQTR
jgi:ABC-type sugar transport system substrate-binding protein